MDTQVQAQRVVEESQGAHGQALAEITRAIAASLDVSQIFDVVARLARNVLAHDALVVLLLHSDPASDPPEQLTLAYCYVCQPQAACLEAGRSWRPADFAFGPALLANQPVIIADLAASTATNAGDQALQACGRAALALPLYVPPRILGGLVLLGHSAGCFDAADLLSVEPVAGLLAIALQHQWLHQRARALAVVEERNRLAQEIHDTLAQSLTGILINLEALKPYELGPSPAAAKVLGETEALARQALADARRSVLGLRPAPLAHQSLREALAEELAGLGRRAAVATQFYVQGAERSLGPDQATAAFRIAQEAFQNIYKHAAARHVLLGLAFEADGITLSVEDDGIGFVPKQREPDEHGGFGLWSMVARARSLGGDLEVASRPGHGAALRLRLPDQRPGKAAEVVVLPAPTGGAPAVQPIRVLVADDHTTSRQGIRRILGGQPDIQVVGEASDGQEAIALTARLHPDVVLLDIQMPRVTGIEGLPRLRAAHPGVEVVMMTMFDQDEQVFASFKAGARGYVLKDASPETFMAAIRAASRGESYLAVPVATRVVERFTQMARRDTDPNALTSRELEILQRMAEGLRYKQIAAGLHITEKTVQYHITNILQKLGADSRSEAVALARRRGLLDARE